MKLLREQSKIRLSGIAVLLISLFFVTHVATGADLSLEGELQTDLVQCRGLVKQIQRKLFSGTPVDFEIARLKKRAENIQVNHLLLQERFKLRADKAAGQGPKALEREGAMSARYGESVDQLLNLLDRLGAGTNPQEIIDELDTFLEKILYKKKNPIFGALPYKNLSYPAATPNSAPPIIPAYSGGDQTVSLFDLSGTGEAPISLEIVTMAQSLNWNPVLIYEWVKNNIETEWYWGCMKGAEETLRQGRGNDCDQAALLVALLRASGFPSRYVRGVIEFHPGIAAAQNLTGIDDPWKIAEFFQKAGIPHDLVIAGGGISNFQIEHIWVESEIPYANYRGAVIDEEGRAWLGLDTSIKVAGYEYNEHEDITQAISLDALREDYLGSVQELTPLEYLRTEIESHLDQSDPEKSYEDYLRASTLIPEVLHILPASLQFDQVRVTHEYGSIPDELLHQVRFKASGAGDDLFFDITLPVHALSNQQIVLTYEPESVEDQEIINGYGGLGNTPPYLVRLRPVLKVNDDRMIVGQDGLPMGEDFSLTLELIGPQGTEKIENREITGKLSVIAIVAQQPVFPGYRAEEDKGSGRLLFEAALDYVDRWDRAEDELGTLLDVAVIRPLPTVVTLGSIMDVSYLLDTPHDVQWRGVYVDADLRAVEAVSYGENGNSLEKMFLSLSSLEGSVLEHGILEEKIPVESISTAKLIGFANSQGIPLIRIDHNNAETLLPTLDFDENILADIANAAARGLTVTIPETVITYEDWTGIGYIKENETTGESGWMLSGMIAGGMTAWSSERWPEIYLIQYDNNYILPNFKASSARYMVKNSWTDYQEGPVGEELDKPLQVVVYDKNFRPVLGAPVTFTVKAGGGNFENGETSYTTRTNRRGVATAELMLGKHTWDNPVFRDVPGQPHSDQLGGNIVDVSLESGIRLAAPFVAYGLPGVGVTMRKLHGDGLTAPILTYSGFVSVAIEDQYGNPIVNRPVNLRVASADTEIEQRAYLVPLEEPCLANVGTWGQCGDPEASSLELKTSAAGFQTGVILGDRGNALYTITAESESLRATFEHYSHAHDENGVQLYLFGIYVSDARGNLINAGPVEGSIPIRIKAFYLMNGDLHLLDNAPVLFNGKPGSPVDSENGLYEYRHTLESGLKWVHVTCTTTINGGTRQAETLMPVFGVTIELETLATLLVDPNGFLTEDYEIGYTIHPSPEENNPPYEAGDAYVIIYDSDDTPITYIAAETMGNGKATISRGSWFHATQAYYAQVVLNHGTGAEMKSERIPLAFMEVDLDIDSDNNSGVDETGIHRLPAEDTEEEYLEDLASEPGKVIRVNEWDFDGDGKVDLPTELGKYNQGGTNQSAPFTPMVLKITSPVDLTDAKVKFVYPASSPLSDASPSSPGVPGLRIWTKDGMAIRVLESRSNGGDYIGNEEELELASLGGGGQGGTLNLYVEGIQPSIHAGDQRIEVYIDPDGPGPSPYLFGDAVRLSVHNATLIPDYNRDRRIDDEDRNRALLGDTFHFWINDDDDEGNTTGTDIPGDDSFLDTVDYKSPTVDGVRDLIDFFPLHLDLQNLLEIFGISDYTYVLKSVNGKVNIVATDLFAEEAGNYLTGSLESLKSATDYASVFTFQVTEKGVDLKRFENENGLLTESRNGKGVLLVEGREAGEEALVLEVRHQSNGQAVFETALPLRLSGVEEMFRHKNLTKEGGGPDPINDKKAGMADRFREPGDEPANFPDPECTGNETGEGKHFVFVHGYNVNGQQARGWHTEMFKRMYWSGSRAKFWGVTWHGWDTQFAGTTPNYHKNVIHAFETAAPLKDFLSDVVGGTIAIAGHSLGNMVVSAALSDHADFWDSNEALNIETYFMLNAAVAAEAYGAPDDPQAKEEIEKAINIHMTHPDWDAYEKKLWASEWHLLFDSADERSKLTWRNRFARRPQETRYYNFYSSGEEVLDEHEGLPVIQDIMTQGAGRYAWALQEKLKGRLQSPPILGSTYGGWGFNLSDPDYYISVDDDVLGEIDRKPITAAEANTLDPLQLPTRPFYKKGLLDDALFDNGSGSAHAHENMSRLLAEALPARTLAAGKEQVPVIGKYLDRNFDMKIEFTTGTWPRNGSEWFHSDVREIAYLYNHILFDSIVTFGGLP